MDLISRLRADDIPGDRQYEREARIVMRKLLDEAAAAIEALSKAVEPLAEKHLYPDDIDPDYAADIRSDEDWSEAQNDEQVDDVWIKRGDVRRARAALALAKKEGD